MQLEKNFVPVEMCMRLFALGLYNSRYTWIKESLNPGFALSGMPWEAQDLLNKSSRDVRKEIYPAFSNSEILQMLPDSVISVKNNGMYECACSVEKFALDIPGQWLCVKSDLSEAEARAGILLKLIELGKVSIHDCITRLPL